METEPDLGWYVGVSRDRGVSPRCPFATVDSCPRYWASLSLLSEIGHTSISKIEDERLAAKWLNSELVPRIAEHDTSVSGGPSSKCLSNYCPEVTFESFKVFATQLVQHGDEIDRDNAYRRLEADGVPSGSWKWHWWALTPMHFTECPLYSKLLHRPAVVASQTEPTENPLKQSSSNAEPRVFVVHGHDEAALQLVARFLEKIDLKAVILKEQPDQGFTIIEKFETYASQVGFAVVLLTPDDLGGMATATDRAARARQNVIFELGYFAGKLGRGRACLLRKGDVEIPSDLYGVIYTEMDAAEGWKVKLVKELKAAGLEFDANRVWE